MAFISALHQICQLISGFSSLVFAKYFICSLFNIVLRHPQPYLQSLALVLPVEEGGRGECSGDLPDAALLMDGLAAFGADSNITCLEWAASSPRTLFPPYLHLVL